MSETVLRQIEGIGKKRANALIATFGSAENVKHASAEEIAAIDGFSPALAREILEKLNGAGSPTNNCTDKSGGKNDAELTALTAFRVVLSVTAAGVTPTVARSDFKILQVENYRALMYN